MGDDFKYLSFPELPDGYQWRHHGLGAPINSSLLERIGDVDILNDNPDPPYDNLVAWVHWREFHKEARERYGAEHTFSQPITSIQDGIDLLAARLWLGMTGVKGG